MNNTKQIVETKRKFRTLVKKDHKFGDSDYVLGRLVGYQQLICDGLMEEDFKPPHGFCRIVDGVVLLCECTPEEYAKFTKLVLRDFPKDLCVFDWNA